MPSASALPTFVLGVDPGPRLHGWALLEIRPRERPCLISQGHCEADAVMGVATGMVAGSHAIVERPQGYIHEHARGADLLDTAWEAGRLLERLARVFSSVHALSPEAWRYTVVGKRTPTDAQIRQAIRLWVNVPKGARLDVHQRDAAGAALAGATHLGLLVNGRGRLPAPQASASPRP